jgi:hypothetical protein
MEKYSSNGDIGKNTEKNFAPRIKLTRKIIKGKNIELAQKGGVTQNSTIFYLGHPLIFFQTNFSREWL